MDTNTTEIKNHIVQYFKENLPQYTVLEIKQKSSHPDDWYLYMVSAKKTDGTYAVWTNWNEKTSSLNHGHYGLASLEECRNIFAEWQSSLQ